MPVRQLLASIDSRELSEWMSFEKQEQENMQQQNLANKARSKVRQGRKKHGHRSNTRR